MQAQATVFLAVCSHNQSNEDLAMSIKWRSYPLRPALTTDPQPEENAMGDNFFARGARNF